MEYKDHTNRSQLRTGSHVSHEQETRNLRLEIDHLRKKLHRRVHVKGDRMPPSSLGSDLEEDCSYRLRLRTPPSEFFIASSCLDKVERHNRRRSKSSSPRNIGNDAMSRALHQISKSPFMCRIDRAKLPHRFAQPTFTIYNGMTDPIEHVSHLNQRMVIHFRNEALMCKVFSFSLGLVAMRWFDRLEEGLISSYEE